MPTTGVSVWENILKARQENHEKELITDKTTFQTIASKRNGWWRSLAQDMGLIRGLERSLPRKLYPGHDEELQDNGVGFIEGVNDAAGCSITRAVKSIWGLMCRMSYRGRTIL
ncbi:hypothetical protein K449DRAFT_440451 [Hypoxylon sp. EC38]|nr:hypothetical protein K449DRAFT_440451 [Hypoxylon sp. EC38]